MTETMENRKSKEEQPVGSKSRRPGQPTKFKPEYVDIAYQFCMLRATDRQLSELFKVSPKTINKWKKLFPEFCQALKDGKVRADAEISKSLFYRAQGFEHKSVDTLVVKNKVIRTKSVRYYPPNVRSIIFWLKNRQPDKWSNKAVMPSGLDEETIDMIVSALPPDIARVTKRKLLKMIG